MIKVITSKDNPRVKYALSLKESKNRKEYKQFLGETKKSMLMALETKSLKEVFTLEELELPEDIKQNIVSEDVLKKIASSVNPEVVFIADEVKIVPKKLDRIVYLDHISDPGNMGTLIRTALAFGYDQVVLSQDCVSIYNEKVLAACKGAIFKMPIIIDELTNYKDYQIIVSTLSNQSVNLDEVSPSNKFILVLGNESHGVSKCSLENADILVKIPMNNIDSINVGVAGGILMYYFSK